LPQSVLVVIHTREMQVLLLRRADMGSWQSVTGSKDHAQESYAQTAVREVAEETGVDVNAPGCVPSAATSSRRAPTHRRMALR